MSEQVRRIRRAARVVLTDGEGCVLLFRYVPQDMPAFWLLPGGECDEGEDFASAARRELLEETGIAADPQPLGLLREFDYVYLGEPVRSCETFFHHRASSREIDLSGHTELEQRAMQEYRWFRPAELGGLGEPFYPADLASLIMSLG